MEAVLAPLEVGRRAVFRLLVRHPALRALAVSKDSRVMAQATLGVVLVFGVAMLFPALLLALSPILLGVPHVASDVRYLVLRPALPRTWLVTVLAGSAALVLVRLAASIWGPRPALVMAEGGLAFAWIAAGVVLGTKTSGRWWRLFWLAPVALLAGLAARHPQAAQSVFAHLHNVVGVAIWALFFRRRLLHAALPVAVLAVASALILAGATVPLIREAGGTSALGLALGEAGRRLSPLASSDLSLRLVVLFAFLQSVHYAVWLGWIPQENVRGEGTLSYGMSVRGLQRDFGTRGLLAIAAVAALVLVGAAVDLGRTRSLYLSLATFHSVLEVAAVAFLLAARPAARP